MGCEGVKWCAGRLTGSSPLSLSSAFTQYGEEIVNKVGWKFAERKCEKVGIFDWDILWKKLVSILKFVVFSVYYTKWKLIFFCVV